MLKAPELAQLKREVKNLKGMSYGEITALLNEKYGWKISRNTVRHYLGAMPDFEGRTKGRPSGSTRERDIWDQLLPELLVLTGMSASRLYCALTHLLDPARLPFGESAFHERTGRRFPRKTGVKSKEGTLLDRCNLRIKIVPVFQQGTEGGRVYLFGYEEFTGYTAFDVITPTPPNAGKITGFIKAIEEHLGLPVRRVCLIGKQLEGLAETRLLEQGEVRYLSSANTSSQLISPYKRSVEIDLLQRIAKKQNNGVARARAATAKQAISDFVQLRRVRNGVWESPAQRRVTQKLQAEGARLEQFLKLRFKLYLPRRRPI